MHLKECGAIFRVHPENIKKNTQSSLLVITGDMQLLYGGFLLNIFFMERDI